MSRDPSRLPKAFGHGSASSDPDMRRGPRPSIRQSQIRCFFYSFQNVLPCAQASSLKRSFQAAAAPPVAPPPGSVIFSGIQPTGIPHIGNYLGALREWVRLVAQAEPSTKFLFSIVDLHAMTVGREREPLWHARRQTLATLLAMGLDPERCVMFYQSAVSSSRSD